ncbi:MAG: hypothetical protein R3F49_10625 [Planctomycetota bacterium]
MKLHTLALTPAALAASLALASVASAQVQPVSFESFDYVPPALLGNQNGGSGWATPWDILGLGTEIVVFDLSVNPPFPIADSIGNYAGQAVEFVGAERYPSALNHADIHDGVGFGRDGATIWISFRTWNYQQFGTHFGSLSLFNDAGAGDVEELLLGSPWGTYAWGIDDEGPNGTGPIPINGTSDTTPVRIVTRIDFMPGQERVQMWLNPAVPHPTSGAQLDEMVHDFRWTKIRLNSGGSGSHYFWDEIIIEKGDPGSTIGTPYCGPAAANSTGNPAVIEASGSTVVAQNNLSLRARTLPNNAFGFFLTSRTQGFVQNPGGSQGSLCLGGAIGRYVAAGQIKNSGTMGEFSLPLNLTATPTPTGLVSVLPGEAWNFQAWYRDAINGVATSNFTDGLRVQF